MNISVKLISALTVIGMVSCTENKEFTLSGELYNKKEKNIYVVYDDPTAKADTIKLIDGKFEYKFQPDTITIFRLLNDSGIAIPIFADKGGEVKFKGSFSSPTITGDGANNDLQTFYKSIENIKDSATLYNTAKTFIMNHRQSYASAYIINDLFIQRDNPDIEEIDAIIAQLDGHVKDCRIIDIIQKNISENKKQGNSDYLNYFSCKDRKGKYVSWGSKNDSYTLINLWASWDSKSIEMRDSLYKQIKSLPKEQFRVLNISLDFNKKEWEDKCKEENDQWIETCDFKGWKNQIAEQQQISMIPYNILVTNNRKIISESIWNKELIEKIKSLTKKKD